MVNPYESHVIDDDEASEDDLCIITTAKVFILIYWVHQGPRSRCK